MNRFRLLPTLLSVLLFAGCSTLASLNPFSSSEETPADTKATEETAAKTDSATEEKPAQEQAAKEAEPVTTSKGAPETSLVDESQPVVDVMWQVPTEPVETYHLSYGASADKLDKEVKIPVRNLEKIDHPAFGPIFHYKLSDVDATKDVFISLRAENKAGLSEASAPTRISPSKPNIVTK